MLTELGILLAELLGEPFEDSRHLRKKLGTIELLVKTAHDPGLRCAEQVGAGALEAEQASEVGVS